MIGSWYILFVQVESLHAVSACSFLFLLSSMDESTRALILSLLPNVARPPDVDEDEWQSLLLLEAPSMLGMAMPGAGDAEASAPTFQGTIESDSEDLSLEDSLAGYSPSPVAAPIVRHGFNLSVPGDLVLEGLECSHPSEQMALHALRDGWLWEEDLMSLTAHLPTSSRDFQRPSEGDAWSCSFLTGAYIHGASAGVLNSSRRHPLVTVLLTSVLRSMAPEAWFSSTGLSLNMLSGVHRDSNNSAIIPNILIPASDFEHGELWIEDGAGTCMMGGILGRLIQVSRPFISFDARTRHATSNWTGNRLILIGYHIRNPELLSDFDQLELRRLGFRVHAACR